MVQGIIFEEFGEKERILLLRAFDYDVDEDGYILTQSRERIRSKENPSRFIEAKFALLAPGSLEIMDGTPTAISEFLIKKESSKENNGD